MRLRMDIEEWREHILWLIDEAECACGTDMDVTDYDLAAEMLREATIETLISQGLECERTYQQSVGVGAIIQQGTSREQEAFEQAISRALPVARREIYRVARRDAEDRP